jgi:hypothetical protein
MQHWEHLKFPLKPTFGFILSGGHLYDLSALFPCYHHPFKFDFHLLDLMLGQGVFYLSTPIYNSSSFSFAPSRSRQLLLFGPSSPHLALTSTPSTTFLQP